MPIDYVPLTPDAFVANFGHMKVKKTAKRIMAKSAFPMPIPLAPTKSLGQGCDLLALMDAVPHLPFDHPKAYERTMNDVIRAALNVKLDDTLELNTNKITTKKKRGRPVGSSQKAKSLTPVMNFKHFLDNSCWQKGGEGDIENKKEKELRKRREVRKMRKEGMAMQIVNAEPAITVDEDSRDVVPQSPTPIKISKKKNVRASSSKGHNSSLDEFMEEGSICWQQNTQGEHITKMTWGNEIVRKEDIIDINMANNKRACRLESTVAKLGYPQICLSPSRKRGKVVIHFET